MTNNTPEEMDGIDVQKYNLLDKRFDRFFATAFYSQIIGAILYEFCKLIFLKLIAIPLFLVAIVSIFHVFYLNSYLEPIRWKLHNTSKGEVLASKFSNLEFYLITIGLIIYDIAAMFQMII
ncbi:hypothetical protein C3432_11835 [Citrobacter amalonaticus]|uniref:Uncharacterized protein n=1 Tax=Citrobacter amalonaticus TaxID=35703 RepID=A0A2S4RRC5_CITAM|nr:hypothetical protein [Citrobacter amalonaticus]POT58566.1 hypothetical protein C3432_11835 [Citrobacter amalonaticus]POT70304.1 hypothetical protein C3436_24535 [Citrobacter amalonaticus]POU61288.1 hypothetical protein C3430_23445 [Citrobacter amalonaticus]POV05143.1 hypothetical protein C3424_07285 [Citrobacter amalonaticus]